MPRPSSRLRKRTICRLGVAPQVHAARELVVLIDEERAGRGQLSEEVHSVVVAREAVVAADVEREVERLARLNGGPVGGYRDETLREVRGRAHRQSEQQQEWGKQSSAHREHGGRGCRADVQWTNGRARSMLYDEGVTDLP